MGPRTDLGANIVLLTIGGMTLEKCLPNFEKPAPTHTTTISIFKATIMFENGNTAKKTNAGKYCSPRAARKMVLSRRPISTSSTIGATSRAGFTSPDVLCGNAFDSESLCTPGDSSGNGQAHQQRQVDRDVEPACAGRRR